MVLLLVLLYSLATLLLLLEITPVAAYSFHTSSSRQSLSLTSPQSRIRSIHTQQKQQQKQQPPSSMSTTRSTQLSMHMGHSHAHHHHDHHPKKQEEDTTAPPKTIGGHVLKFSRRPVVRLVFSFLVAFLPALVRRGRCREDGLELGLRMVVRRPEVAAFGMIFAALTFADGVRREVKRIMDRIMEWKDGIVKHTFAPTDVRKKSLVERLFGKDESREQAADRVTLVGGVINLVLSLGKLMVGVTCHSSALIADAGHSLSDLFSDFITLWAVQIARLPPDDDHPYGHGKFEAVGALFLALTLLGTGLSVGAVSNAKLLEIIRLQRSGAMMGAAAAVQVPTFPALIMAFASIVSKEWLYRITRRVGEDLNSQVVLANAWHHRSDAYSSILALISIALAMLVPGMLWADSAAGLLVGGMICMTGAEILGEAVKQLTDASADEGLVKNVQKVALQKSADVLEVTNIRTRQMGSKAFVDVYITTSESLSNSATRAVEERVKYAILKNDHNIVDADVHANSPASGLSPLTSVNETLSMDDDDDDEMHSHSHSHADEDGEDHDAMEDSTAHNSEAQPQAMSSTSLEPDPAAGFAAELSDDLAGEFVPGEESAMLAISSFQEVEDDARDLLNDHAAIKSIEGCTVHYDEALREVQVDVTIKLENPDWTTITIASSLARELTVLLEEGSPNIAKANIFLDLNGGAGDKPMVASSSSNNSTVSPLS